MSIAAILPFSTVDFPGVLACVIFTQSCDLNCFYCHNRALIENKDNASVPMAAALEFLRSRKGLLDGVAVSGGEPALWPELETFLCSAHELGFKTKLDTNGQHPGIVAKLLKNGTINYVALDIKALHSDCAEVCGSAYAFERAQKTAKILEASGVEYELRTTLYPGLTLEKLLELMSCIKAAPYWRINIFRQPKLYRESDIELLSLPAISVNELREAESMLRKIQPNLIMPG